MNVVKIIGRTLTILAVALVIVGMLLAIGSGGTAAAGPAAGAAREMVGHHGSSGPNLFGIVSVVMNLGVIAAIIAIVSQLKRRLGRQGVAGAPARRQPTRTTSAPQV